jgi:hypothetical protein
MVVYDGLVEQVSLSSFEGGSGESMTRVEVSLAEVAEYEVVPSADGLVVRLWADGAAAQLEDSGVSFEETASSSDDTEAQADPWSGEEGASLETAEAAAEVAPAPPATILSQVGVTETAEGVLIHMVANGAVGAMETFTLENPDRLVVDLPGLGVRQWAPSKAAG